MDATPLGEMSLFLGLPFFYLLVLWQLEEETTSKGNKK